MDEGIGYSSQVVNGLAVLLAFFVGYRYAIKRNSINEACSKVDTKDEIMGNKQSVYNPKLLTKDLKMVLIVRNDLKMGKGKIAAQCCHGAVGAYQKGLKLNPQIVRIWENNGSAKVALKVESEKELKDLQRSAALNQLSTCLIHDAGRTQIAPNTCTVLAIGPAAVEDIDKVTGHLKLL